MDFVASTPIVNDKLIPPPPRKLWGNDSVTEQLYKNKWSKYRNSVDEKDSWSQLEAPGFVDFENIPEPRDSFFYHPKENEKFVTPQRTLAKRLPGLDSENNNIIEALNRCALSAIKKCDEEKIGNGNQNLPESDVAINLINNLLDSSDKSSNNNSTLKSNQINDQEIMDIEAPKPPDDPESKTTVQEENPSIEKSQGKNSSNSGHCTITEPFSFEFREKYKQEHRQARRERDSAGKEVWKGFRANPVPNYLKLHKKTKLQTTIEEKKSSTATNKLPAIPREKNALLATKLTEKKNKINNIEMYQLQNAAEIWKKKAFEPIHPKRSLIQPKPPQLFTAIRARERQRFEEKIREKERERQAILQKEEAERKKREEEEIAKLRRELVHKAQPIRKYKLIVPRVEKRPLTEPTTPITCKRRRKL